MIFFINWTLRTKLQWNFSQTSNFFIQENAFEDVVAKRCHFVQGKMSLLVCTFSPSSLWLLCRPAVALFLWPVTRKMYPFDDVIMFRGFVSFYSVRSCITMSFPVVGACPPKQWHSPPVDWYGNNLISLIGRFMGPTWGPSGTDRTQVGPMLAPWTLLSGSFRN